MYDRIFFSFIIFKLLRCTNQNVTSLILRSLEQFYSYHLNNFIRRKTYSMFKSNKKSLSKAGISKTVSLAQCGLTP